MPGNKKQQKKVTKTSTHKYYTRSAKVDSNKDISSTAASPTLQHASPDSNPASTQANSSDECDASNKSANLHGSLPATSMFHAIRLL